MIWRARSRSTWRVGGRDRVPFEIASVALLTYPATGPASWMTLPKGGRPPLGTFADSAHSAGGLQFLVIRVVRDRALAQPQLDPSVAFGALVEHVYHRTNRPEAPIGPSKRSSLDQVGVQRFTDSAGRADSKSASRLVYAAVFTLQSPVGSSAGVGEVRGPHPPHLVVEAPPRPTRAEGFGGAIRIGR